MWGEPVPLQNIAFGEQKQISSVISIEIEQAIFHITRNI
jgi:hypothetical protein